MWPGIFLFPLLGIAAKISAMTVEPKPTSPVPAGRPRSLATVGWVVSALIHVLVVAGFLMVSTGGSAPSAAPRQIPTSTFEPETEPLEPEALVDNLQMAPLDAAPAPPDLVDLPAPPDLAAAPAHIAVPAVAQSHSSFVLAGNSPAAGAAPSRFCGLPATGDRICYVVDCSGSMVMAFDYVRREVKRAVAALNPGQYFHVIFFAGGDPIQLMPSQLRRANLHQRNASLDFVDEIQLKDVVAGGAAWQGVVKALDAAMAVRTTSNQAAQVIYLFTDGEFDHDRVAGFLTRMQQRRPSSFVINVVACGSRDNEPFLRQLASNHQGRFRFLTDEQLAAATGQITPTTPRTTVN